MSHGDLWPVGSKKRAIARRSRNQTRSGVICVDHALMCTVAMYLGRGPIRVRLAHSLKANNDSGRSLSFFFVLFCVCISSTPNSKPWQTFDKS